MSVVEIKDIPVNSDEENTNQNSSRPEESAGDGEILPAQSAPGVDLPSDAMETEADAYRHKCTEQSDPDSASSSSSNTITATQVDTNAESEPLAETLRVELPPMKSDTKVESGQKVELPALGKSDQAKVPIVADSLRAEGDTSVLCSETNDKMLEVSEGGDVLQTDSDMGATALLPVQFKESASKTDTKSGDNSNSFPSSSSSQADGVYHVKWINFKKKQVPIVTQNENGPCPLLAIMNVLLLQNRVKLTGNTELITVSQLMAYLGECVLENVPSDEAVAEPARLNFEQNMQDAMAVMHKLQTGLDVNVRFTGVRDFEYTTECIIFDLLQISLYHGWLVDPQNKEEVEAVSKCSYNQLVEKIISQKSSDKPDLVSEALIAEQFLEGTASQITYHGLCELCSTVKEDELCVLFRNNHFTTLYRHKNELFQLVTDQGFLTESKVVWETLSNVEGDSHFVDSEFHTYTKTEPLNEPVVPPSHNINTDEQIDQDYLVALSLQQEQQMGGIPQDQMAWGQVAPQQQPQISDLELARSLQEEERRAAEAEVAARSQQSQQQRAAPQGSRGNNQAQRRPNREPREREEKKSDVVGIPLLSCISDNTSPYIHTDCNTGRPCTL